MSNAQNINRLRAQIKKQLLFTSGQVNFTRNIRAVIAKEDICHRESDVDELLRHFENKRLTLLEKERM